MSYTSRRERWFCRFLIYNFMSPSSPLCPWAGGVIDLHIIRTRSDSIDEQTYLAVARAGRARAVVVGARSAATHDDDWC